MTYDECVDAWEASRLALESVREFTATRSAQCARRLSRHIGSKQVDDITVADIEAGLVELRLHGNARRNKEGGRLTSETVRKTFNAGNAAVKWAIRHGLATRNAFDAVDRPKSHRPEATAMSDEQARRAVDTAMNELDSCMAGIPCAAKIKLAAYCMFIVIAIGTGMRRSEIIALDWKHVDLDARTISVTRAVKSEGVIDKPKTKQGIRRISIGANLASALETYRAWQERVLKVPPRDDSFVLAKVDGTPISGNCLEHYWRGVFAPAAGLDEFHIHSMRHTHATMLISRGVDIKTVQTRLGHSSAVMTLDVYSHAVPRNDQDAANDLDSLVMDGRAENEPACAIPEGRQA